MNTDVFYLSAINGAVVGNKLIMVNMLCGVVLEYDLDDLSHTVTGFIRLPDKFGLVRVTAIIPYNENLYMTLEDSEGILCFSKRTGEVSVKGSRDKILELQPHNRADSGSYLRNDEIWSLPFDCNKDILKYSIKSNQFEMRKSMKELLKDEKGYEAENLVLSCRRGNSLIYMVVKNTDILLTIDMDAEKFMLHHIGEEYKIKNIERLGEDVSLTVEESDFFLRLKEDFTVEIISFEDIGISKGFECDRVFMYKGKYVAIATHEPVVYMFDEEKNFSSKYDFSDGFRQIINTQRTCVTNLVRHENYLYLIPFSMNCFVRINLETFEGERFSSEIQSDLIPYYLKTGTMVENMDFTINDYIDYEMKWRK